MPERSSNVVSYIVGDDRYDIDTYDIDATEWRAAKRASGLTQTEIWRGALFESDLECIGVLVWMWRRREEPDLQLDEVLKGISFGVVDTAPADGDADPPA